ncbi:MAG: hypothetical protein ABI333_03825 [bacterium]
MQLCRVRRSVLLPVVASILALCTGTCESESVGGSDPAPDDCGPCAVSDTTCPECGDGRCDLGESTVNCPADCQPTLDVDLLMVVDNSGSMSGEAAPFYRQIPPLVQGLRQTPGGLPNLHIGVISTDVSVGPNEITYCDSPDDGRLVGTDRMTEYILGGTYLADVRPVGCSAVRDATGLCSSHDCDDRHCAQERHTVLEVDSQTGCPRCRNFGNQWLEDAILWGMELGTMGCGFEQPLEALRLALDDHPDNTGFLRDDSLLAIWIYTDEDDCSASDTRLFSDPDADIDSELGPLTSYRCFEWSTACDIDDRTVEGPRTGCVERTDDGALLHPISRYLDFLCGLRAPGRLLVAGVTGPVTPSADGVGVDVTVYVDEYDHPALEFACTTAMSGALPAIRLHSFFSAFNTDENLDEALTSACSNDLGPSLLSLGRRIAQRTTDATLVD